MLPEPTESLASIGDRFRPDRSGMLLAVSVTLLCASIAPSFAGQYPVATTVAQSPSKVRPCTPLELYAGLQPAECGTLTLSAVVTRLYADHSEGDDG